MSTDDTAPDHPFLRREPEGRFGPYSLRLPNGSVHYLTDDDLGSLLLSADDARGAAYQEDTGDTIDRLGLVVERGGGAWTVEGPTMARGDTMATPRSRGLHLRAAVQVVAETMARLEREGWSKR